MKTTASTNSPAIALSAAGIGLRRRFVDFGAFRAGGFSAALAGSVAGTSAFIGRVIERNATRAQVGGLVS
jgi:hypothetical protein